MSLAIRWRLNYRNITLTEDPSPEGVPISVPEGRRVEPWLGFINAETAEKWVHASKATYVALVVDAYSNDYLGVRWEALGTNETLNGCKVKGGVYCIVEQQAPQLTHTLSCSQSAKQH